MLLDQHSYCFPRRSIIGYFLKDGFELLAYDINLSACMKHLKYTEISAKDSKYYVQRGKLHFEKYIPIKRKKKKKVERNILPCV